MTSCEHEFVPGFRGTHIRNQNFSLAFSKTHLSETCKNFFAFNCKKIEKVQFCTNSTMEKFVVHPKRLKNCSSFSAQHNSVIKLKTFWDTKILRSFPARNHANDLNELNSNLFCRLINNRGKNVRYSKVFWHRKESSFQMKFLVAVGLLLLKFNDSQQHTDSKYWWAPFSFLKSNFEIGSTFMHKLKQSSYEETGENLVFEVKSFVAHIKICVLTRAEMVWKREIYPQF